MTLFGILGFSAPWLLLGLLALPILWIILRAVPPAPIQRLFPGVVLLLGLKDDDQVTDRTPWWLLLLRCLAIAAVIIGLAGPVLNPEARDAEAGSGPLLVVMDATWGSAPDWDQRQSAVEGLVAQAGRDGRPVGLLRLTAPEAVQFQAADAVLSRIIGLSPEPWLPGAEQTDLAISMLPEDAFDTIWLSDGIARDTRDAMLNALEAKGDVVVFETPRRLIALDPARFEDGLLNITLRRLQNDDIAQAVLTARGTDPAGNPALLYRDTLEFADGEDAVTSQISLPAELRARITKFEVEGVNSAAAVSLPDDGLRRREIAMIAGREGREGLELLSPLHFLEKALAPNADLINGEILSILPANADVIILADVATLGPAETEGLSDWMDQGGLLLRFAGPRLAASDVSREEEHSLMPVRLRAGGRSVGGAMSWGEPKSLAPFGDESPFFGLALPGDVSVSSQVMAQPDPSLSDRVIAQLSDGTPLVTRKRVGQGQVVLFHVTANAEWSSLPLSGLFVQMLERLAVSTTSSQPEAESLEGTVWKPVTVVNGFGNVSEVDNLPGVDGARLIADPLSPDMRPGIYQFEDKLLARNVITPDTELGRSIWPDRVSVQGLSRPQETPLAGWLLALAIALLGLDIMASLAMSGRLWGTRLAKTAMFVLALSYVPTEGFAQSDEAFLDATAEVVLAHVLTGNARVDEIAEAGLFGLSETLFFRTSVEPAAPHGINLERDELALYPFLYWPVTEAQSIPSATAYAKLNTYLRSGGMIMFDTRDADIASFGSSSAMGRKLQQLAAPLDIPPLEPIPQDHVLTRTFYLLQDFPGRYLGRDVWVEAAPPDAEQAEGMPFRNLNDNVTPIVIGGNDWAAAWAMDTNGQPLVKLGRGFAGERQREIAYRFGVNLIMHVLTGNYKSDQVHVPALLDRLGQ